MFQEGPQAVHGDGRDSIGVRRGNVFYLTNDNVHVAETFVYGRSSDQVLAGDLNGDGKDEVIVVRST